VEKEMEKITIQIGSLLSTGFKRIGTFNDLNYTGMLKFKHSKLAWCTKHDVTPAT